VLLDTLLAPERRVARRVAQARPAPIGELGPAARGAWRAFVVGLAPLLLLVASWRRAGGARRRRLPRGAGALAQQSAEHPAALRDRVTTPGGTTIAGLAELERYGVRSAMMEAVEAATERSEQLSRKL
jgi:hypothetical protein